MGIALLCFGQSAFSQALKSEADLKKQAGKLFEDEEYIAAYPLYSQLLSLYPKEAEYNYKFGTCMLFSTEDKEKPITYLERSVKNPEIEKEAYFFLGKAYHLNYRFDDAIRMYNEFKKLGFKPSQAKLQVDKEIDACNNGKKLLKNITDISVVDKKELSENEFYRTYDLSDIGGKLLVKPDDFRTSIDKKKKEKSIVYLTTANDQIYFSSYGDKGDRGREIYIVKRLPNGEFSKPQPLGPPINTAYDEDYPFLHPNGRVLYFSSKGHNSMGGYDVFKSVYNEENNTWSQPVNLDFPINTPDDDILFVTDSAEQMAYFSSARTSIAGEISVYKIKLGRKPIDVALIKGTVVKGSEGQKLNSRIIVKNIENGETMGIFTAKEQTGEYLIQLPNGGKYLYTVETEGFRTQSEPVEVPIQYELKALKQQITYEQGIGTLVIKNMFDQEADESNYMLAMDVIKEKAKLEVNTTEAELAAALNTANESKENQNEQTNTSNNQGALSNKDLVKIAYEDAKEAEEEARELKAEAALAYSMANESNDAAVNKTREAQTNPGNIEVKIEAEKLTRETVAAYNIAKQLDANGKAKQEEADLSLQYAKELENAIKSNNSKDALARLEVQQKKLDELSKKNESSEKGYNSIKAEADNKQAEATAAAEKITFLEKEINDLTTDAASVKADAEKTENPQIKSGMQEQAKELEEDIVTRKQELVDTRIKAERLQKEADALKNEAEVVSAIMAQVKWGNVAVAEITQADKAKIEQQVANYEAKTEEEEKAFVASAGSTTNSAVNKENSTNSDARNVANTTNENTDAAANTTASEISYPEKHSQALALAESNNQGNIYQQELARSEVYKNWSADIENDIKETRVLLKNTKNKEEKKNLTAQIKDLENQLKEKQGLYKDALASADKAKASDGAVAASNTTTTTTNSNISSDNSSGNITTEYMSKESTIAKISDPLEKETEKVKLYNEWASEIEKQISSKKEELASARTPEDKQKIEQQIELLDNIAQEKKSLAEESLILAADLKNKEDVASTTTTNTITLTSNTIAASSEPLPVSELNEQFNVVMANTAGSALSDVEKENKKAEIYKAWSDSLYARANKSKADLSASTDEEEKAFITNRISVLEEDAADKKKLSEEALAKADRLERTPTLASGSNTSSNEIKSIEDKFKAELSAASNSGDDYEKETNKAEVYKAWSESLADAANDKKEQLKTATREDEKKSLSEEIALLDLQSFEKKKLSEDALATAEKIKLGDVAAVNTSNASGKEPGNTGTSETTEVASTGTNKTTSISYTSDEGAKLNADATALSNEAASLRKQANDIKINPAASLEEKLKAVDLKQTADTKELEAQALFAKANNAEYSGKKQSIEQLSGSVKNVSVEDSQEASRLNTEAQTAFKQAEESRTNANAASSEDIKKEENDKALQNELIALEKQQRAIDIYLRYTGDAIAVNANTSTENNIARNNSSENTSSTGNETNTSGNNTSTETGTFENLNTNNNNNTANSAGITLSPEQIETTKATSEYVQYSALLKEANEASATALAKNTEAADLKRKADTGEKMAASITANAETITDEKQKQEEIKKADDYKKRSKLYFNQYDSVSASARTYQSLSEAKRTEADSYLKTLPAETSGNLIAVAKAENLVSEDAIALNQTLNESKGNASGDNETKGNALAANNTSRANESGSETRNNISAEDETSLDNNVSNTSAGGITTASPVITIKKDVFVKVPGPAYSASKPIPINEKLPEGLVYKVQIGAFRNPIPQDLFTGMEPLTGERTPNGLTRYTAGLFTSFANANAVKNEIRDFGYKDAFVVAFYNGRRISLAEAQSLIAGKPFTPGTIEFDLSNNNVSGKTTGAVSPATIELAVPAIKSTEIKTITGLFYTVQVGVYTRKVTKAQLFNIEPLYSEPTANGLIRYTTGIFNSVESATETKRRIVGMGVKDAFITAYLNGQRITMQAAKLLEASGNVTFANPTAAGASLVSNTSTPPVGNTAGVVYKIQIGAYREEVPNEMAAKYLKIADKGVTNYVDERGLTIYTVGEFTGYESAAKVRDELTELPTAFIVAYQNGKKIPVDEARKLLGQ